MGEIAALHDAGLWTPIPEIQCTKHACIFHQKKFWA